METLSGQNEGNLENILLLVVNLNDLSPTESAHIGCAKVCKNNESGKAKVMRNYQLFHRIFLFIEKSKIK